MNNYPVQATAKMSSRRNVARLEKELMRKRTLKQRFKEWLFDDGPVPVNDDLCIDEGSIQLSRERSIKFEIHNANGGRIVQTRRYDAQKDRHFENLYIITGEQDFGRELDKIITMEALR
jgi:hypothetical protein